MIQGKIIKPVEDGTHKGNLTGIREKVYNEGSGDEYSYIYFDVHLNEFNMDVSMSCTATFNMDKNGNPLSDLAKTLDNLGVTIFKDGEPVSIDPDSLSVQLSDLPVMVTTISEKKGDKTYIKVIKIKKA